MRLQTSPNYTHCEYVPTNLHLNNSYLVNIAVEFSVNLSHLVGIKLLLTCDNSNSVIMFRVVAHNEVHLQVPHVGILFDIL